ncbi:hypothetical protein [Burkholderia thailandensis]|uniref:hypothetical protein n=1 Tax=Burkholderia thailandensis TaxID=57975 RepID=UPI00148E9A58|nr:hypothetical protein [Burkholderia thailandensis]
MSKTPQHPLEHSGTAQFYFERLEARASKGAVSVLHPVELCVERSGGAPITNRTPIGGFEHGNSSEHYSGYAIDE